MSTTNALINLFGRPVIPVHIDPDGTVLDAGGHNVRLPGGVIIDTNTMSVKLNGIVVGSIVDVDPNRRIRSENLFDNNPDSVTTFSGDPFPSTITPVNAPGTNGNGNTPNNPAVTPSAPDVIFGGTASGRALPTETLEDGMFRAVGANNPTPTAAPTSPPSNPNPTHTPDPSTDPHAQRREAH